MVMLELLCPVAIASEAILVTQTASDQERPLFQQDLTPIFAVTRGDEVLFGQFDQHGNFIEGNWARKTVPGKYKIIVQFSDPQDFKFLNAIYGDNERVLEYRSGRLVEGVFDYDHGFIPIAGKKVTAFKDYQPGKNSLRIYNLPGYFVEKPSIAERPD
jgi:hypothetical protein